MSNLLNSAALTCGLLYAGCDALAAEPRDTSIAPQIASEPGCRSFRENSLSNGCAITEVFDLTSELSPCTDDERLAILDDLWRLMVFETQSRVALLAGASYYGQQKTGFDYHEYRYYGNVLIDQEPDFLSAQHKSGQLTAFSRQQDLSYTLALFRDRFEVTTSRLDTLNCQHPLTLQEHDEGLYLSLHSFNGYRYQESMVSMFRKKLENRCKSNIQ